MQEVSGSTPLSSTKSELGVGPQGSAPTHLGPANLKFATSCLAVSGVHGASHNRRARRIYSAEPVLEADWEPELDER
jgi:hypothetical protein